MIRRSTWIFLTVFVILLGVAIYTNRTGSQETETPLPTPRPQVVEIEAGLLRQIQLESAEGELIILDKNALGTWQLLEPVEMQVGSLPALENVITSITSLQALSTLETRVGVEQLGLSPAAYTLTLRSNDSREQILRFGSKTPTGSGYYVQNQQGSLFVVSTFNIESVLSLLSDPTILVTPTPLISPTAEADTPGVDPNTPTPVP